MSARGKGNQIKTELWIASASLFVIGLLLFIWPTVSGSILCYLMGAACCGYGIFQIISYFNRPVEEGIEKHSFVKGLSAFVAGIVLFVKPELLASVLPFILGCILIIGSIFKLQVGLDLMRIGVERWYVSVMIAIVICILGILAIINPFAALFARMRFIGVSCIAEGISDIIASLVLSSQRNVHLAQTADKHSI